MENKKLRLWGLTAFLGMSAWLYFADLKAAGLFHWDEAYYSVETRLARELLKAVPQLLQDGDRARILAEIRERCGSVFPSGVAKPTFIRLLALASSVIGMHDYTIAVVGALFGWLTIGLLYLLARDLKNSEAGLWSAVLLTFSTLHLLLSRGGFPNVVATFFFLASMGLLLRRRVILSGLLAGVAYTCHYGLLPNFAALGFLLAIEAWRAWRKGELKWGETVVAAAEWAAGFLLLPVAWSIVDLVIIRFFGADLHSFDFHTYAYYVFRQSRGSVAVRNIADYWRPLFYPLLMFKAQGFGYALVFLGSAAVVAVAWFKNRLSLGERILLPLGILVTLAWICNGGVVVTRAAAFFIPLQCLTIGWVIAFLPGKTLKAGMLLLALIPTFASYKRTFQFRSGYGPAAEWVLSQTGAQMVPSESEYPWYYYVTPRRVFVPPATFSEAQAAAAVKAGTLRYMAVDHLGTLSQDDLAFQKWSRKVVKQLEPVAVIDNKMGCDEVVTYDLLRIHAAEGRPEACLIRIYDLRQLL